MAENYAQFYTVKKVNTNIFLTKHQKYVRKNPMLPHCVFFLLPQLYFFLENVILTIKRKKFPDDNELIQLSETNFR